MLLHDVSSPLVGCIWPRSSQLGVWGVYSRVLHGILFHIVSSVDTEYLYSNREKV